MGRFSSLAIRGVLLFAGFAWGQPEGSSKLDIQDAETPVRKTSLSTSRPSEVAGPPVSATEIELDPTLVEPAWDPGFSPESGLRLWDCIVLALENNRPLRNAREDLRSAIVTLRERREEFGNIYTLGAGLHYDEIRPLAPPAFSQGPLKRDRFSFSFGGTESGGTFLSRGFPNGGRLSLGAQTVYNSQTATRLRPFFDDNGDLQFLADLQDVRWFSEANIVITQPLLEGAGRVATTALRIQELEKAARNLGLEREIQRLINEVVTNYLRVQLRISLVEVSQQSYDRAVDQFRRTVEQDIAYKRTKMEMQSIPVAPDKPGGVDPIALVRTKQQITTTRQQLINAKNDVESGLIDLRLSLGLEPDRAIVLAGTEIPDVSPPAFSVEEAVEYGLRMRPDYRIAEIVKRQAEINLEASENRLLPNLDLSWRMALREQDDDFAESWKVFEYEDAGADLTLALPLNLPSDRADYERSRILVRQALNDLEQLERVVANNIDEALRALNTLGERIGVLRKNEELARLTYEKLVGKYEFGDVPDPFDVVRAQDDWTRASADRVIAEINYVIASAALDLAMGRPISELLARYAPPETPSPSP